MRTVLLSLAAAVALSSSAAAQDAVKGKQQFGQCAICHTVGKGEPAKQGPNLFGVMGKKAGTNQKAFAYSPAMKASGLTWTPETLNTYITSPARLVPQTNMSFVGVSRAETRANIVAYLISATK